MDRWPGSRERCHRACVRRDLLESRGRVDAVPSISVATTGATRCGFTLFELTGAENVLSPVDTTGTYASGSTAASYTTITVTGSTNVAYSGEFGISAFGFEYATASSTSAFAAGTGWTNQSNDSGTSNRNHGAVDYTSSAPSAGSAASDAASATSNGTGYRAAVLATFAPPHDPGPVLTPPSQPPGVRVVLQLAGQALASVIPQVTAAPPTPAPLYPLTQPVDGYRRLHRPPRGIVRGIAGAALFVSVLGPPVTPLHGPVHAARPLPPAGKVISRAGAFSGTGPALTPLRTPVKARQPLPPRGVKHTRAGLLSGTGPAVTPLHQPVQPAVRPLPRRGTVASRSGTFSGLGPHVTPLRQPVRAVPVRLPSGRAITLRIVQVTSPVTGPPLTPLHQPVRAALPARVSAATTRLLLGSTPGTARRCARSPPPSGRACGPRHRPAMRSRSRSCRPHPGLPRHPCRSPGVCVSRSSAAVTSSRPRSQPRSFPRPGRSFTRCTPRSGRPCPPRTSTATPRALTASTPVKARPSGRSPPPSGHASRCRHKAASSASTGPPRCCPHPPRRRCTHCASRCRHAGHCPPRAVPRRWPSSRSRSPARARSSRRAHSRSGPPSRRLPGQPRPGHLPRRRGSTHPHHRPADPAEDSAGPGCAAVPGAQGPVLHRQPPGADGNSTACPAVTAARRPCLVPADRSRSVVPGCATSVCPVPAPPYPPAPAVAVPDPAGHPRRDRHNPAPGRSLARVLRVRALAHPVRASTAAPACPDGPRGDDGHAGRHSASPCRRPGAAPWCAGPRGSFPASPRVCAERGRHLCG